MPGSGGSMPRAVARAVRWSCSWRRISRSCFAEGELVELVGLLDAAAVVADGLDFVVEVEAEHVFGLLAGLDGLGGDGGHAAEVVDLVGEDEGVGELFGGVDGELGGDVHVGRALEDLRVVDVGDDGLELALEVFVEEVDELFAGDRTCRRSKICRSISLPLVR